jgi:hypothetical protein
MRLYGPKDVDKSALRRARIAILGYGSQGRAHALNLKDSGFDVVVGVRKGDSWNQAKRDGLTVRLPVEAVKGATLVVRQQRPAAALRLEGGSIQPRAYNIRLLTAPLGIVRLGNTVDLQHHSCRSGIEGRRHGMHSR